jgi:hypothetical protein
MKINAQCRRHVKAWHESGLSQADYCRQQDVNPKTFSRWARLELANDKDADSSTNCPVSTDYCRRSKHDATICTGYST